MKVKAKNLYLQQSGLFFTHRSGEKTIFPVLCDM